ncbi:MAG: putative phosphatase [Chlamydiae bacterium]|nr:putative phosphatase [Chlamydiota bacterium]
MEPKGVIAFDIDGTLTHRLDWIDPKVVQRLEDLTRDNWRVALLTGRIFSFAWNILQHLNFPYLLGVQNGADILEMPSKKSLKRNYLSAQIIPQIEKAYLSQKEDFIIYAGIDKGDFCYYRKERYSEKMVQYLKVLEKLGAAPWQSSDFIFDDTYTFPLIKCFGEEKEMRTLYNILKHNPEIEVSMIRDPIDRALYLNLITHPEASKGQAVHFLREYFQTPLVIAAGDDHNDLKMLQEADVGIAIETAPEEILAYADVKAKPASELGIIDAIEEAIALASRT